MLAAAHQPHGYEALFLRDSITDPGEKVTVDVPVVAWDDTGAPLVVNDDRLMPAAEVDGYYGVRPALPPMLTALPGDGWQVEVQTDTGPWTAPVIAWLIRPWGLATPIAADPHGEIGYPQELGTAWRVWHPAGKEAPTA